MVKACRHACRILMVGALAGMPGAGCALAPPAVTLTRASVRSIDFSQATIDVGVHVQNPNPFPLIATSLDYDLAFGGSTLLHGTVQQGLDVPAAGAADLVFPVSVRWAGLAGAASRLFAGGRVHYEVDAQVGFNARLTAIEVPLVFEGDLPLPRPPEVRPTGISVTQAGLGGLTLQVGLAVKNDNPFGFSIDSAESSLTLAGVPLASTTLGPLAVAASGTARTSLIVSVPGAALVSLARAVQSAAAAGGAVPYRLSTRLVIDSLPLGSETRGTIQAPPLPAF